MTVIDYATSMPEWFGTFLLIAGLVFIASLVVGVLCFFLYQDNEWLLLPLAVFFIAGVSMIPAWGEASLHVAFEEKQRIAVEVSEVSGVDVSVEEVDLMLAEKPVRGVYYIKNGTTLVVEEQV